MLLRERPSHYEPLGCKRKQRAPAKRKLAHLARLHTELDPARLASWLLILPETSVDSSEGRRADRAELSTARQAGATPLPLAATHDRAQLALPGSFACTAQDAGRPHPLPQALLD